MEVFMKKILCTLLCVCMMTTMCSCGYPNESVKAPANWPEYAVGEMQFPCEAGWTAADVSGFTDAAVEPFQLVNTSNGVNWVSCLTSPEWATKTRNFLAISYLNMGSEVKDSVLEEQLMSGEELKAAFLNVNMTVSVLSSPEIVKYGDHTVLTYTCRFAMTDGTKMVVQVGMLGHGDRLYQFHYVDYQSESKTDALAQILTGLEWIEKK